METAIAAGERENRELKKQLDTAAQECKLNADKLAEAQNKGKQVRPSCLALDSALSRCR